MDMLPDETRGVLADDLDESELREICERVMLQLSNREEKLVEVSKEQGLLIVQRE